MKEISSAFIVDQKNNLQNNYNKINNIFRSNTNDSNNKIKNSVKSDTNDTKLFLSNAYDGVNQAT